MSLKRTPAKDDYPNLTKHNNFMSKALTEDIYIKLRERVTPNGYTIDDVIQTGVDNPGMFRFPSQNDTVYVKISNMSRLWYYCDDAAFACQVMNSS